MQTKEFDYHLPQELIAQQPLAQRDASRLLVYDRHHERIRHGQFTDILGLLQPGDILVGNDSRVIPARLYGRKPSGGKAEILLLSRSSDTDWLALVGGKKIGTGSIIELVDHEGSLQGIQAVVTAVLDGSLREIRFSEAIAPHLTMLGHTPLPPYIHAPLADGERYQTVYSRPEGSAAAPTAGLHFTGDLLLALREKGVSFETVTLHIGLDTFKPVTSTEVAAHQIHSEWASLSAATALRINEAKLAGGRLIALGTTAVRTLETGALHSAGLTGPFHDISARDARGETSNICPWQPVAAFEGATDLFIYPGYVFRAVDAMITNFHLPQSSLLMLVAAFMGREQMQRAYATAVSEQYRFYSFGDAMFIQ